MVTPRTPVECVRAAQRRCLDAPQATGLRTDVLTNRAASVAFLCYHSISNPGPPYLSVGAELFERQLAWLRRAGWETGSSAQLNELLGGRRAASRTAFLTFDDGYLDTYTSALPLLRAYNARAIVFVLPPVVDTGERLAWPEVDVQRQRYPHVMQSMTWSMLEELASAGVEIGSHGLSHQHLDRLEPDELHEELLDSRRAISERIGDCRTLAYPFGDWSPRVAAAAAETGYEFAFTIPSVGQWRATRWSIPRIPVDHRDQEWRFALKLSASGRSLLLSPVRTLRTRWRKADRG